MDEASWVGELIRKEVGDWDDELMANARFKAFSGQRSDWEHKYLFWRDLILKVARHLGLFIIRPSQVKNIWFNRGGLTPLCLDHVLLEMYDAGDILRFDDLVDTTSGRLSQIFRRIVHLMGLSRSSTPVDFTEDHLILWPLLKEICGGSMEASAVLCHLSGCRKAKYLVINKQELMEGVKVSLSPGTVCATTSLDYNILYLICTSEKLQQQLDLIDQRCEKSRKSGLASLKSGNKVVALRHARELKLASQSREKCTALSNRVEEVLRLIADAECSKKVSEAIQIGARAIKENKISLEEVELCLQELDESLDSQKQVEKVLESTSSYAATEDEDLEEELKKLELEVGTDSVQEPVSETGVYISVGEAGVSENTESLSEALSNLKLTDGAAMETVTQDFNDSTRNYSSKDLDLEAA